MFERFLNTLLDIGSSIYYVRKISRKLTFVTYVCVLGGKKCCFFGKFCVRTKWIISNLYQFLKCFILMLMCSFTSNSCKVYIHIWAIGKMNSFAVSVRKSSDSNLRLYLESVFGVFLVRIQSECGEIRTRKSPNTHTSRTDSYLYTSMITLNRKYYWLETSIVFLQYLFFESSG